MWRKIFAGSTTNADARSLSGSWPNLVMSVAKQCQVICGVNKCWKIWYQLFRRAWLLTTMTLSAVTAVLISHQSAGMSIWHSPMIGYRLYNIWCQLKNWQVPTGYRSLSCTEPDVQKKLTTISSQRAFCLCIHIVCFFAWFFNVSVIMLHRRQRKWAVPFRYACFANKVFFLSLSLCQAGYLVYIQVQ